jgi:hypothetical protein
MHHALWVVVEGIASLMGLLFASVFIAARMDKARGKRKNAWYSYVPEFAMENYYSQSSGKEHPLPEVMSSSRAA